MTDREAFEQWWMKVYGTEYAEKFHRVWQAATFAERERCAKVCDAVVRRQSYGHAKSAAGDCADFIRSGE